MARMIDRSSSSMSVGTAFLPDGLDVTYDLTSSYARAVNDENPWYLNEQMIGGAVAPPMFGIVPAMRLLRRAGADGSFDLQEDCMLHAEQDMRFLSPIRPGDALLSWGWIACIRDHPRGSLIDIEFRTYAVSGEEKVQQTIRILQKVSELPRSGPEAPERRAADPLLTVPMEVAPDQTFRYASASFTEGIRPHEDEEHAKSLGYRTMFLQGQCTMAFAAQAVVNAIADGDPTKLRRIRVRFADQVYPGDTVTTRIWSTVGPNVYEFDAIDGDGRVVLKGGAAELDPPEIVSPVRRP